MTWTWRYEDSDGGDLGRPKSESFPSQSDAESWLGENWRDLGEHGVVQVSLLSDGEVVYGPMSLENP